MTASSQPFELIQLLSLLNKRNYLDVKEEDVVKIVHHVYGPVEPDTPSYVEAMNDVIDYIADKYTRLVEAAAMLIDNPAFDRSRYNSLINLFRMTHYIEPMGARHTTA